MYFFKKDFRELKMMRFVGLNNEQIISKSIGRNRLMSRLHIYNLQRLFLGRGYLLHRKILTFKFSKTNILKTKIRFFFEKCKLIWHWRVCLRRLRLYGQNDKNENVRMKTIKMLKFLIYCFHMAITAKNSLSL